MPASRQSLEVEALTGMNLNIYPVIGKKVWPLFAPHHYLTGDFSGMWTFLAVLPETESPVALTSSRVLPHHIIKQGRREHRTVVLHDFQGLGIGARLSDRLGEWHLRQGHRLYSRTSHPRLGAYREVSPLWRATGENRKPTRPPSKGSTLVGGKSLSQSRNMFAHEYVGHRLP